MWPMRSAHGRNTSRVAVAAPGRQAVVKAVLTVLGQHLLQQRERALLVRCAGNRLHALLMAAPSTGISGMLALTHSSCAVNCSRNTGIRAGWRLGSAETDCSRWVGPPAARSTCPASAVAISQPRRGLKISCRTSRYLRFHIMSASSSVVLPAPVDRTGACCPAALAFVVSSMELKCSEVKRLAGGRAEHAQRFAHGLPSRLPLEVCEQLGRKSPRADVRLRGAVRNCRLQAEPGRVATSRVSTIVMEEFSVIAPRALAAFRAASAGVAPKTNRA